MNEKMMTQQAKEIYNLRAQTVEPIIGDIKENKGVQTFLTRSLETVKTEFNLTCTACNLKKIWTYMQKKNDEIKHNFNKLIQKIFIQSKNFYLHPHFT